MGVADGFSGKLLNIVTMSIKKPIIIIIYDAIYRYVTEVIDLFFIELCL